MNKSENTTEATPVNPEEAVGQARRSFLKTAGKFAVYTPPAVMMLMKPGYARMNKSMTGRPHHGKRGDHGGHHEGGHHEGRHRERKRERRQRPV
ncbi:MAG: hypothetical protein ACR2O5_02590 [Thiogranum sp.]